MTTRQQEIVKILEDVSDYEPHKYCKRALGGTSFETYFNIDGDSYYVRFYHHYLHANGNIITETSAYKKEVTNIK